MLRPGFPRLSHPEVAHAIPSVGFMAQVYRRVRLLVSPTIVGVQLTDQQRTAQAPRLPLFRWDVGRHAVMTNDRRLVTNQRSSLPPLRLSLMNLSLAGISTCGRVSAFITASSAMVSFR